MEYPYRPHRPEPWKVLVFLLASIMAGVICALAVWEFSHLLVGPRMSQVGDGYLIEGDEESLFDDEVVSILLAWVWSDPTREPENELFGIWLVRIIPGRSGVSVLGFSPWLWLDGEGRRLRDVFDNPNLAVAAHFVADEIERLVDGMGLGVGLEPGADAVLVVDQYAIINVINRYGPVRVAGADMDGQEVIDYLRGAGGPLPALERQRIVLEAMMGMLRQRYTSQQLTYLLDVLDRHGDTTLRRRDEEYFIRDYILNLAHKFTFVVLDHVPVEPPPPDGLPALRLVP